MPSPDIFEIYDSPELINQIKEIYQSGIVNCEKIAKILNDEYRTKGIDLHISAVRVSTHIKHLLIFKEMKMHDQSNHCHASRIYNAATKLAKTQSCFSAFDIYQEIENSVIRRRSCIPTIGYISKHLENIDWAVKMENQNGVMRNYQKYRLRRSP